MHLVWGAPLELQPGVLGLPPLEHVQAVFPGRQVLVLDQVVWAPLEVGQAVAQLVPEVLVLVAEAGLHVEQDLVVPVAHLVAQVWQRLSRWYQGGHVDCQ